jgi:hypothetical protein
MKRRIDLPPWNLSPLATPLNKVCNVNITETYQTYNVKRIKKAMLNIYCTKHLIAGKEELAAAVIFTFEILVVVFSILH